MYKARKSKYFTLRCVGTVNLVTKKYAHARLVFLDDCEDSVADDIQYVKIPISAFCEENSIPKSEITKGFSFYMYVQTKSNKKKLILEKTKERPMTKTLRLGVKRKMKQYCKVFHGDNWKEIWKTWKIADEKDGLF